MKKLVLILMVTAALSSFLISAKAGSPPSTAFTYQGQLQNNGSPANGSYDLTFTLFNLSSGGIALDGPLTNTAAGVTNGLFIVTLDYGAGVFTGVNYWLEIGVRTNGGSGFTTLAPRQQVTPTPYAIYSLGAGTAGTANGVASSSITAASIAAGQVVKSLNGLTDAVTLAAGSNVTITPNGNTLTVASTVSGGGGSGWSLTGNAGTTPGTDFLGTTDNEPLELWVNGARAFRLEPGTDYPNVVGGSSTSVDRYYGGGATIAGGIGNTVNGDASQSATIGGGSQNMVSNSYSTVSGGVYNKATANDAVVAGGYVNTASGGQSTVSGGVLNTASGTGSFVGGGGYDGTTEAGNTAGGAASVVAGGLDNFTTGSYATISGGANNQAGSANDTVPGGQYNVASGGNSFAAGSQAKALNYGSFVWADSSGGAFQSTANDQFSVRAYGGVRFVTGGAGMTVDGQSLVAGSSQITPPANGYPILNMVYIVPGTFVMGAPTSDPDYVADETQHVVTLTNGFWMGQHLVTQGEYLAVVGNNPSTFTGDLSRPVEQVTWFNASNFCYVLTHNEQSAGRLPSGWVYRLPTEAEWEYCCRALTTSRYYFGNDPGDGTSLTNYAWYFVNSGGTTQPVGQLLPNAWGLVDMAGNVFEWCQDWYGTYPTANVSYNPQGPASGSYRVFRGGCWSIPASNCRSADRGAVDPTSGGNGGGFRVVLAPGQ